MYPAPPRPSTPSLSTSRTTPFRLVRAAGSAAALAVLALVPALPAQATALPAQAGAPADVSGTACADDAGVTVVVDLTDLGEDIRVGCAEGDPATGREALESAGFTTADSVPGMICAVDGLPDPCPEEFDGNYWAYFSAEADGEWTARTEGADTADPAPGTFEGWRYNDGSAGPGVTTAELTATAAESTATADDTATAGDAADTQAADDASGPSTGLVVGLGAAAVALVLAVVLLRRRGRA
ncbi:hypothetical protein [Georgenia daeguensis]|uniref:DUF4430 domain-containing protein n=1 Tax=Georgenia daeguensis TaxID=908355 RepID=A0ABP8ENS6_9MICO